MISKLYKSIFDNSHH